MKGIITQSNYIPWKGYFDSIANVDIFVVYDDMQYTKRDWRNRNLIKTSNGLKWLSIPVEVKGKYFQKIKDTKIADKSWVNNHVANLKQNYSKSKSFKEVYPLVEEMYMTCNFNFLTEVNMHFIRYINSFFGITTKIIFSSDYELHEEKNQRLLNLCKDIGIKDYYSGPAARNYMDLNLFSDSNINVHFWDYSGYPVYNQLNPPFEHSVSIIDLLFNEGENSKDYFKFGML